MEEFKQAQTNIVELKSKQPQKPIFYLALVINDEAEGIVDLLGKPLKDKGKKVNESADKSTNRKVARRRRREAMTLK
ncbi:hypothetical protein P3S67_000004 [Capsicum chacoense]